MRTDGVPVFEHTPARGGAVRPAGARDGGFRARGAAIGDETASASFGAGGGAADVAEPEVWGGGVGEFPGVPWDAFEMIMASLRYKLALREKSRRGTSR